MIGNRDPRTRSGKRFLCLPSPFKKLQPLLGILLVGLGLWGIYGSTRSSSPRSRPALGLSRANNILKGMHASSAEEACDQLASVQRNMDDEGGQCQPLSPGEPHVGWIYNGERDASPHALTTLVWKNEDKCLHSMADRNTFAGSPVVSIWDCSGGRVSNEMWTLTEGVPGPITSRDGKGKTWCLTMRSPQGSQQPADLYLSECQAGAKNQEWTLRDHYLSIKFSDSDSVRYATLRDNPQTAVAAAVPKEQASKVTFVPLQKCNWPSRWIMRPSACKVCGELIEELDPLFNYRRGVEIGYMGYGEDKTHLLPWLLASKTDLTKRRRKVLLDFGGATFDTSTQWFLQMYPLNFDEIYVFEVIKNLYVKPPPAEEHPIHLFRKAQLDKITVFEGRYVSTKDSRDSINITRWMLEDIKLTPEDAVIVKMDIESEEWNILPLWMKEHKKIATIVDELFVEVHFGHPSMIRWDWDQMFPTKSRRDALQLMIDLRAAGIYTHIWP